MLNLIVNDQPCQYQNSVNLSKLLEDMKLSGRGGIAIAVNDVVIPKANWENYVLNDKDAVILITATQGG
ncbi:sulfur carrier protein ThiS [Xanthovirga aplysinae]|uniref:sulfur carrier protein ThiS n=1 Tax=Xanthovirga aplysinae TaxID=2529853 RepID=UPI0012BB7F46|nr:sulfur carrier protein ThiS [Xanthovirga aplysinae]MTI33012.1 sulfur carrier protein ThiS [Xanthovirga aplysinae]